MFSFMYVDIGIHFNLMYGMALSFEKVCMFFVVVVVVVIHALIIY